MTYKVAMRQQGLRAAMKSIIKRDYTYIEALKNVSFSINDGEIIGYIGPNGAGKSTTIKILSGILVPTSGDCSVFGKRPWDNRIQHVRNIGVVFGQRSQLIWDIPVIDSFELLKDIYKVTMADYKKNLDELVEIFSLAEFINTPVRQLSLGQRMRCEIAASLLHNPKILFLDEPTIGLDAVSKVAVRNFIKRINKENGVTVMLTTHDMGDIDALTDRVMLIGKGQILYNGSFAKMKSMYNAVSIMTVDYDANTGVSMSHLIALMFSENSSLLSSENVKSSSSEIVTLLSNENGRAVLSIDTTRTNISHVISHLTQNLTVNNIGIESRPIEEIIAEVYKEFSI